MPTFASRIRSLRHARRQSQQEFAAWLGVARATLASWEVGRRLPEPETLTALAAKLAVSVDYLLGLSPSAEPPRYPLPGSTPAETVLERSGSRSFVCLDLPRDMPEELRALLLSKEAIPYILAALDAARKGIDVETLQDLIEVALRLRRPPRQ